MGLPPDQVRNKKRIGDRQWANLWLLPLGAVLVTVYFFPNDTWLSGLALVFALAACAALATDIDQIKETGR